MARSDFYPSERAAMRKLFDAHSHAGCLELLAIVMQDAADDDAPDEQAEEALRMKAEGLLEQSAKEKR